MLKQKKIMLPTVADAKEFVQMASRCDFDIDIFYNRIVIDAKSILGVLSLDLTRELTVSMNGEDAEFEAYLDKLADKAITAAYCCLETDDRLDKRNLRFTEKGETKVLRCLVSSFFVL